MEPRMGDGRRSHFRDAFTLAFAYSNFSLTSPFQNTRRRINLWGKATNSETEFFINLVTCSPSTTNQPGFAWLLTAAGGRKILNWIIMTFLPVGGNTYVAKNFVVLPRRLWLTFDDVKWRWQSFACFRQSPGKCYHRHNHYCSPNKFRSTFATTTERKCHCYHLCICRTSPVLIECFHQLCMILSADDWWSCQIESQWQSGRLGHFSPGFMPAVSGLVHVDFAGYEVEYELHVIRSDETSCCSNMIFASMFMF